MPITYDPAILDQFASQAYQRADRMAVAYPLAALLIVFGVGVPLDVPTPMIFAAAVIIAILAYAAAVAIGARLRLEAQRLLCLSRIEANTRAKLPSMERAID